MKDRREVCCLIVTLVQKVIGISRWSDPRAVSVVQVFLLAMVLEAVEMSDAVQF